MSHEMYPLNAINAAWFGTKKARNPTHVLGPLNQATRSVLARRRATPTIDWEESEDRARHRGQAHALCAPSNALASPSNQSDGKNDRQASENRQAREILDQKSDRVVVEVATARQEPKATTDEKHARREHP
jgi:hypothetical protein